MTGWRQKSACAGGECIEVRPGTLSGSTVHLRRVLDGEAHGSMAVTRAEFAAFIAAAKAGEYDDLTGETS